MRDINLIVVHCSATKPDMDIGADWIRNIHVNERGWNDIGYHYVIRRNGVIETGRPESKVGAHTQGHNLESIGICLVGGVDDNLKPEANYTLEQYAILYDLIRLLVKRYPKAEVLGHRDLDPRKECPCFDVAKWYDAETLGSKKKQMIKEELVEKLYSSMFVIFLFNDKRVPRWDNVAESTKELYREFLIKLINESEDM